MSITGSSHSTVRTAESEASVVEPDAVLEAAPTKTVPSPPKRLSVENSHWWDTSTVAMPSEYPDTASNTDDEVISRLIVLWLDHPWRISASVKLEILAWTGSRITTC
jgi:hypothetical protein